MGIFDFLKGVSSKKRSNQPFKPPNICANCFSVMPDSEIVCNNCGHNKNNPITKFKINIQQMIYYSFSDFYDNKHYNALCNSYRSFINKITDKKLNDKIIENNIINELIFMQLTLKYALFLDHYRKHPKINNFHDLLIKEVFEIIFKSCINEEQYNFIKSLFLARRKLYCALLKDPNYLNRISDVLSLIIASIGSGHLEIIKHLDPDLPPIKDNILLWPSLKDHLLCQAHIFNIMSLYKLFLNKFEILD